MKYVREHINEKFTEDSDPVQDMGIGIKQKIIDLQKEYRKDNYGDKGNFIEVLEFYIDNYEGNFEQKEAIMDYLLTNAKNKNDRSRYLVLTIFWHIKPESEMLKYFDLFNKKGINLINEEDWMDRALGSKLYKIAQFLLDLGFNVDMNNGKILSDAFVRNDNKAIDWLLKKGAKLRVKDRNNRIFKAALKNADQKQIEMCAKAYLGIK